MSPIIFYLFVSQLSYSFQFLVKSTMLHCAFHLRRGGVQWPLFLLVIISMLRKWIYGIV